jgi:hypothetical protein
MNITDIICTPRALKSFILDLNNPSVLKFATITLKLVGCHGFHF